MDKQEELYPYIYSIYFKNLTTKTKKRITTEPIKCSQCGAVLVDFKEIINDPNIGASFKCKFCGTLNAISQEHTIENLPDDIDFIIEDVVEKSGQTQNTTKIKATEGELYIAVIDISGSMNGAKIEAVKQSLVQTIRDFKVNSQTTKFILIAFESSVYYYLRYEDSPLSFDGDILFSTDGMKAELRKYLKENTFLGSIGEFADGWIDIVKNLRSMDMTALGPALFMAAATFELLESKSSGRLTLLTDGLANRGIGNLSGPNVSAEKFYEQMADLCNANNVVVDVVGVSSPGDNNEMGLQTLGKLTDNTGGNLYLISSQEMEAAFSELRQRKYLGKDVKVRLITPKDIEIKNITGAYSSKHVKDPELNLGAVTEDREIYIELNPPKNFKSIKEEEIPIQLQVEYKDADGRKRLRVMNDRISVTDDEKTFKTSYNQELNAMMNIQAAGSEYYSGKATKSKKRLKTYKKNLMNEMASLGGVSQNSFSKSIDFIDDEINEIEEEQDTMQAQAAPKASYMASKGQMRSRMSRELKELKIKKKHEDETE